MDNNLWDLRAFRNTVFRSVAKNSDIIYAINNTHIDQERRSTPLRISKSPRVDTKRKKIRITGIITALHEPIVYFLSAATSRICHPQQRATLFARPRHTATENTIGSGAAQGSLIADFTVTPARFGHTRMATRVVHELIASERRISNPARLVSRLEKTIDKSHFSLPLSLLPSPLPSFFASLFPLSVPDVVPGSGNASVTIISSTREFRR